MKCGRCQLRRSSERLNASRISTVTLDRARISKQDARPLPVRVRVPDGLPVLKSKGTHRRAPRSQSAPTHTLRDGPVLRHVRRRGPAGEARTTGEVSVVHCHVSLVTWACRRENAHPACAHLGLGAIRVATRRGRAIVDYPAGSTTRATSSPRRSASCAPWSWRGTSSRVAADEVAPVQRPGRQRCV